MQIFRKILEKISKKKHIYDYIISIGMNCEIMYQIKEHIGAVDSSLLSWAAVPAKSLVKVLKNPKLIFSGEIEEWRECNMWHCQVTNITFHGQKAPAELLDTDGKPDETKIELEKQDTISRVKYLIDKFIHVARSKESKLYILGIHPHFCEYKNEELRVFVQKVFQTIQKIANNASLLIIVSKENINVLKNLDNDTNFFVRVIDHFAPFTQATSPQYVDLRGGKVILSEFRPKNIRKDTKVYKFEKVK